MSSVALVPRMSEKAYAESTAHNTYVFVVPMTANESIVAAAVAEQFKVTVEDVRTVVVKGKAKQSYRKGKRPVVGKRADFKKAYVRIKTGDKINIFGEEEKTDKKKADQSKPQQNTAATDTKQKRGLKGVLGRAPRQTQSRGGDK